MVVCPVIPALRGWGTVCGYPEPQTEEGEKEEKRTEGGKGKKGNG